MKRNKGKKKLIYTPKRQNQRSIRNSFIRYRESQVPPIPIRCDNAGCGFYVNPLIWNGKPLGLILDHINGVNSDNRPENLRFLCPNCNAQLETNAGRNRGRVKKSDGGFAIKNKSGLFDYTMPVETAEIILKANEVIFELSEINSNSDMKPEKK